MLSRAYTVTVVLITTISILTITVRGYQISIAYCLFSFLDLRMIKSEIND